MDFKKSLVTGLSALAFSLPGAANAGVDFVFNWAATGEGGVVPVSSIVDELKFTAESVVVFNGAPFTAGTTFTDYVTLRVDQLFNDGSLAITPYGPLSAMEITVTAVLTGQQVDANNYIITGFQDFNLFYDGPAGGYTQALFQNLATFADGTQVEDATSITGAGTNATLIPDGALDLFVTLLDLVTQGSFESLLAGTALVDAEHVLGVTNSNNALCGSSVQTCFSTEAAILAFFGVTADPELAFHTRSDGSIEKLAIPEPATLGLLGLALAMVGFVGIRRRKI